MENVVELSDEQGRWRTRPVSYWTGPIHKILELLPRFETREFRASPGEPANPSMRMVIRLPRTLAEQAIPVGTVSNSYLLAQHTEVAAKVLDGLRAGGVDVSRLKCELGLTELGEWMNLRFHLPFRAGVPLETEAQTPRIECVNSVDGSSRLAIFVTWWRLVCRNGMVVPQSRTEFDTIHIPSLDLDSIPPAIGRTLNRIDGDFEDLIRWCRIAVREENLHRWINECLSEKWGKKAACRVYHICRSGHDVTITDPFAPGNATEKPTMNAEAVPGSKVPAVSAYDVAQALSWVATRRNDSEERVQWQSQIPTLISVLEGSK